MAGIADYKVNILADYAGRDHASNVDEFSGLPATGKARFDALPKYLIEDKYNPLIDSLASTDAGEGISQLGMEPIDGMTATDPQGVLEELKAGLDGVSGLDIDSTPDTDATVSGITADFVAAGNIAFGDVCYIASTGKATLVDADAIASMSGLVMCADATISADATGSFLMIGFARNDAWNWTVGGLIYGTVTATTGNTLSQTAPSGASDVVQVLGVATHADRMFFNPSLVQVEIA